MNRETIYLIIKNPKNKDFNFKVIRCCDYSFGDFIKSAEIYYKAGYEVSFKRFN